MKIFYFLKYFLCDPCFYATVQKFRLLDYVILLHHQQNLHFSRMANLLSLSCKLPKFNVDLHNVFPTAALLFDTQLLLNAVPYGVSRLTFIIL